MNAKKIDKVKVEMGRLAEAIKILEKEDPPRADGSGYAFSSRYTAAVKRASMDLTRTLADLRRPY